MKESVIYQDILLEGIAKGKAEGIAKGKAEGIAKGKAEGIVKGKAEGIVKGKAEERNQIALKMLGSGMSADLVAQFTGLTIKQIEKLQKSATDSIKKTKPPRARRSPKSLNM